jgi:hypothetical protein
VLAVFGSRYTVPDLINHVCNRTPWSTIAGGLTILFQLALIAGGNLSFLNLLTIVLAIPLIDGGLLRRWLLVSPAETERSGRARQFVMAVLALMVGVMSIRW